MGHTAGAAGRPHTPRYPAFKESYSLCYTAGAAS